MYIYKIHFILVVNSFAACPKFNIYLAMTSFMN